MENFRPKTMPVLGITYETLRETNPSLVMVSISNFGQTGPYRDYEATDIVEYALSGIQYIFGDNDREPLKHGFNQAQFKAGTDAASAALIALYHRAMSGKGQWIDISIQECVATGSQGHDFGVYVHGSRQVATSQRGGRIAPIACGNQRRLHRTHSHSVGLTGTPQWTF